MVDYQKKPWWWQPLSAGYLKLQLFAGVGLAITGAGQARGASDERTWWFWVWVVVALSGIVSIGVHARTLYAIRRGDTITRRVQ